MLLRTCGGRRRGALVAVLMSAALSASVAGQGKDEKTKVNDAQRADAQALVDLVEGAIQGKAAGNGLELKWARHYFLKAQGEKTYVPFVLIVPSEGISSPRVGLYLRVAARSAAQTATGTSGTVQKSKSDAPQYAFEDLYFFDLPQPGPGKPHRIARAFAVPPGDYDVYAAITEHGGQKGTDGAKKSGVTHQAITVPNFSVSGLTTSDIIVAEQIETLAEPITSDSQADHPFTFGQMQIVPALEHRFMKKDELKIVFWIYGAGTDTQTKKPDANIEYKFHRVEGDKQTYFNKTDPQPLNAQTLPAQFDLAAGHQLSGSLGVPLASFPEGNYRLEIEVQDKAAGKQVTRDVSFTVAP
jgi:hypothetical protein